MPGNELIRWEYRSDWKESGGDGLVEGFRALSLGGGLRVTYGVRQSLKGTMSGTGSLLRSSSDRFRSLLSDSPVCSQGTRTGTHPGKGNDSDKDVGSSHCGWKDP